MNRRTYVEFVSAAVLVVIGIITLVLPILNIINVKLVLSVIMALYGITHIIKNFSILNSKDYSGFSTALACAVILVLLLILDINNSPWNLALLLFIWVILLSLIKLKESDYYHDRKNKLWKLNIINLVLFIITGILTAINLYYTSDVQILVIGFFFLINGILDFMDPLVAYIIEKK